MFHNNKVFTAFFYQEFSSRKFFQNPSTILLTLNFLNSSIKYCILYKYCTLYKVVSYDERTGSFRGRERCIVNV